MRDALHIIPTELLPTYIENIDECGLRAGFDRLAEAEISSAEFSFYTSVSSVFSSKIEGESIELDSYVKHKKFGVEFEIDYTRKTDDLYEAYVFAQQNRLTEQNIQEAHKLLSRNILATHRRGQVRTCNMYVLAPNGQIEYVACPPDEVARELEKYYADLETLLSADLNLAEAFFFAAMLHLVFVKIHPMDDGNGRTARLIEKWFLAEKLGAKSWYIQSEKLYYDRHEQYYGTIRKLGLEYAELDYSLALDFLGLLPKSIENDN